MSHNPTRLEIKTAVEDELSLNLDVDVAIQELQDRAYQAGLIPDSREELEIDLTNTTTGNVRKATWEEYECIIVAFPTYDSLLKVRDNKKPYSDESWSVVDVDMEHQQPGSTREHFVDHNVQLIDANHWRVYQLPESLKDSTDKIRGLFRVKSPIITADTSQLPFKSIYTAKIGLMAIGYENEGDPRAESTWQLFYREMGMNQRRSDGVKERHIKFDFGLRHKPTNFG